MPSRLRPLPAAEVSAVLSRLDERAARGQDGSPDDVRAAVKHFLAVLTERAPGKSVEVRVPPYAAVQCIEGARHTRGTPPAVVETDGTTWLALARGRETFAQAQYAGRVRASGERSDLTPLLPLTSFGTSIAAMTRDLRKAVADVLPGIRTDLEDLVRIPSVGADPARHEDVRRSAAATAALFEAEGFETEIVELDGGLPAVIGRKPAPEGKPTVLLYAHHDVQPEGDHMAWHSPPFEPTERDGRLFGRGAADDKAGVAAHLAAIRAHGDDLPVGVTVFIEGEEESGSDSLSAILQKYKDILTSDVMVIADSGNWDIGVPALTTSLRGLAACTVEVRTLEHAVHSGMWGGVAPDALTTLIQLLATLHDAEGNVAVEGLVSGPAADLEYPDDRLRAESGLLDGVGLLGSGSVVERLWTKPAISIIALDATRIADASNTLLPVASASVSMRIAPGDDATRALQALQDHLTRHAPFGAKVSFSDSDTGEPFAIDATGPAYDAAREAFKEAWDGTDPVDMGVGGSIPFIAEFAAMFPDAAILVTGVEDPDTRAHGANEGLHLAEFERVCLAEALLLRNLAR